MEAVLRDGLRPLDEHPPDGGRVQDGHAVHARARSEDAGDGRDQQVQQDERHTGALHHLRGGGRGCGGRHIRELRSRNEEEVGLTECATGRKLDLYYENVRGRFRTTSKTLASQRRRSVSR